MNNKTVVIATRESPLAIRQTEIVKSELEQVHPQLNIHLLGLTTQGDKILSVSLSKIGGKGLFVKELEQAMLEGKATIAAHSMKDVPMVLPQEFTIPAILSRDDPRDVFVSNHYQQLMDLPQGAILGTSSLRRQTQLTAIRPDLQVKLLRGNVNTRLRKLDDGEYDAIILAAAGLKRMNFDNRIQSFLSPEECLPSAGQGAIGVECLVNDEETIALLAPLNDPITNARVTAERAVCRRLNGGCSVPIAAYAEVHHDQLYLRGLIANPTGTKIIRAEARGDLSQAETLGLDVAEDLLSQGALQILKEFGEQ